LASQKDNHGLKLVPCGDLEHVVLHDRRAAYRFEPDNDCSVRQGLRGSYDVPTLRCVFLLIDLERLLRRHLDR
jgi:hypothetical protein